MDREKLHGGSHAQMIPVGLRGIVTSMSAYFNNPEMSDVMIKLNGTTYHAHKFVLGLMSDVFRTMCSQRWDGNHNIVEIQECEECVPVFEKFLRYLYCGDIEVDLNSALPLLMLADKYNVEPLKQKFEDFMKRTVKDGSVTSALRWFTYAQVSGHSALQFACVDVIITKMDEVVSSEEFVHLEFGFLIALLGRDDLVVLWEKTLFHAAEEWIHARSEVSNEQVQMLLSLIRFPMMLPEQLYDIETNGFYQTYKCILSPMLTAAHRFRSIAPEVYDVVTFSDANFRPRNYTHSLWCHYLTAETNGETFYQNSVGVRCVNHPVIAPPEQYWQIRIMGEKRSSRNSNGNKPTFLPLGYAFSHGHGAASLEKTIRLVMTVTPLRPIKQDIVVDIALFQVKKDKISKLLCHSSVKFNSGEYFSSIDLCSSPTRKCSLSGPTSLLPPQSTSSSGGPLKFSPTPMNFAVMFQQPQPAEHHEVTLRYNFSQQDFDHPAEIPCFKFNGLPRITNSVRLAIVFKPRFVDFELPDSSNASGPCGMLLPTQSKDDSGLVCLSDNLAGDHNAVQP